MSDFRQDTVRMIGSSDGTMRPITIVVMRDKHLRDVQQTGVHVFLGTLPYVDALTQVARELGRESGDAYTVAQMEVVYDIDVRYEPLRMV